MKIIRDTRERKPWFFPFHDDLYLVDRKIDAGDYTTENLEGKVVVERKASTSEIAGNLGKKAARERFYREFSRMESLEQAYIVCEFPESDVYVYPDKSGLSTAQRKTVRMNGKYLRRLIYNIEEDCPFIEVVFCKNREAAEDFTYDILKFWENEYARKESECRRDS